MKFVALSTVLLPAIAVAQAPDLPTGRFRKCFFAKTFEKGSDLSESGTEDFIAVAGAEVRCYTGCASGGAFTTTYDIDGVVKDSASEENEWCESTSKFTIDADITSLGWNIEMPNAYLGVALTCFW